MTLNGKRRWSHWKWALWLAVAISVGGVIYLLGWYVPDVLVRHKTDPSVESAWISGVATLLGVGATAAVAIFAFWYARSTNQATIEAAKDNLEDQREQLDKTLAEQRTRTLNERFATAADRLGSDRRSAVRLAGVYAMAGLADDWPENRQTCVDVLCAYLRLPYNPDPGESADPDEESAYQRNREVRHTVIRVITAHLQADMAEAKSWQGLNLDFTGVVFDGGDFSGAEFSGGEVSFVGPGFSGGTVDFTNARDRWSPASSACPGHLPGMRQPACSSFTLPLGAEPISELVGYLQRAGVCGTTGVATPLLIPPRRRPREQPCARDGRRRPGHPPPRVPL